jgi:Tol biopolymer transport system component
MLNRCLPVLILFLSIVLWETTTYTGTTQGSMSLYAPLVQRQEPTLPDDLLLLVVQEDPVANLVWYNPDGTFRYPISNSETDGIARISPDGTQIVFNRRQNDNSLHTLLINAEGGTPLELSSISGGYMPYDWSPDGRYLAYGNSGAFYTYEVATGISTTISVAHESFEYVAHRWHPQTFQAYYFHFGSSLFVQNSIFRANGDGSEPTLVFETDDTDSLETILGDGRLVVSTATENRFDLTLLQPDGSDYELLRSWSRPFIEVSVSPSATGLLYEIDDTLYWEDFAGQPVGDFTPPCNAPYDFCYISDLEWQPYGNALVFTWSQQDQQGNAHYQLYTLAMDGTAPQLITTESTLFKSAYSPDGRYLAYEVEDKVMVRDMQTQTIATTLTAPGGGATHFIGWRPTP